jgi:hypothetical protein
MARGPLPKDKKARRNAPTIPKTFLPASGRTEDPPSPPDAYTLGQAGREWWDWAWHTPQAVAWDDGALYVVARRAALEDDLAAHDSDDALDLSDLLAGADEDAIENLQSALSTLKRSASSKLAVKKEMRELDKVLGLTPKAMAELRWSIVRDAKPGEAVSEEEAPEADADADQPAPVEPNDDRRARLSLVKDA